MNQKILAGIVVIILVIGAIFIFTLKRPANDELKVPLDQAGNSAGTSSTSPEKAGIKSFEVSGANFFFSPAVLRTKKGDLVKIVFRNTGGYHDFKIDELNVATRKVGEGSQDTIEFIANKEGTFEYYCSVGNHRQMGMKGILVVE